MKISSLVLTIGTTAVFLTGCVNPDGSPDRTGTSALTGGAIGAASGAMIGGGHGRSGEGALIGAAVGLIAGGLIGHSMDQEEQVRLRQQAPQTYVRVEQGQPLGVADVKALAQANVSDDVIISQIRNSRTIYHLSTSDIIDLNNSGVSAKVIDFMINTPSVIGGASAVTPNSQTSAIVVEQQPPPVPVETVVAAPRPGYVWIGGEWIYNGGWVWVSGHWGYPPHPGAAWVPGFWTRRGPHSWGRTPGHWR